MHLQLRTRSRVDTSKSVQYRTGQSINHYRVRLSRRTQLPPSNQAIVGSTSAKVGGGFVGDDIDVPSSMEVCLNLYAAAKYSLQHRFVSRTGRRQCAGAHLHRNSARFFKHLPHNAFQFPPDPLPLVVACGTSQYMVLSTRHTYELPL